MRLWTIQHEDAYTQLMDTGVLHAPLHPVDLDDDENLHIKYEWMVEKMRNSIGEPPSGVKFPIWAWHTYCSKHSRIDLRRYICFMEKGTPMVQMEIEIPDDKVLLSDYDLWVAIEDGQNLLLDSSEAVDEFGKRLAKAGFNKSWYELCNVKDKSMLTEEAISLKNEVISSWDRCFDIDAPYIDFYEPKEKSIQGTFWELWKEDVINVWHFKSRGYR